MKNSVLNIEVSLFENYGSKKPVNYNLLAFLQSDEFKPEVDKIRSIDNKKTRDDLKYFLPCITPSGQCFPTRAAENLVKHSGLMQFDIDSKANPGLNFEAVRDELKKIPEIAYCGLSVSGRGVWGLVPIAYPEKHKQHFSALYDEFKKIGLTLDKAPQNVASLRGYSFDSQAYFNHNARTFFKTCEEIAKNADANKTFFRGTTTHFKESEKTEYLIKRLVTHRIDITGTYSEWLAIASCFACEFGEAGRGYFHEVSQFYNGYKPTETDKQYNACLRNSQGFGIGIFYRACADYGILFKPLLLEHNQ